MVLFCSAELGPNMGGVCWRSEAANPALFRQNLFISFYLLKGVDFRLEVLQFSTTKGGTPGREKNIRYNWTICLLGYFCQIPTNYQNCPFLLADQFSPFCHPILG